MTPDLFESSLFDLINERSKSLEDEVKADVVSYHGSIYPRYFRTFRNFIEEVRLKSKRNEKAIAVVLRTSGGSAETTERMVGVLRQHYEYVYFIVPDVAYSAGTIFCMSGDKIYMDYASSLGPIDPQVPLPDSAEYVPAMGYLDKVEEITKKDKLAPADVVLLKGVDLGKLALFEQARDLSVLLLKKWLVDYKFRNWTHHRTTKKGSPVTPRQKEKRAEIIATDLADHKRWKSHGRNLDIIKLNELRIEIDDYSNNSKLTEKIRAYNDPLTGFVDRTRTEFFLHNRLVPF